MKIRFTEKNIFGSTKMKNATRCIIFFILTSFVPLLIAANETPVNKETPPLGAIKNITATHNNGTLTVTMKTDRILEPKTFRLENPSRLVLDFQNTVNKVPFMKLALNSAPASQLRVSQFTRTDPQTARVVFDLGKDFSTHKITLNKTSVKITLLSGKTETGKTMTSAATKPVEKTVKAAAATTTKPVKKSTKAVASTTTKPVEKSTKAVAATTTKPIEKSTKAVASTTTKPVEKSTKAAAATTTKPVDKSTKAVAIKTTKPVEKSTKAVAATTTKPVEKSTKAVASTTTKPVEKSTKAVATKTTKPVEKSTKAVATKTTKQINKKVEPVAGDVPPVLVASLSPSALPTTTTKATQPSGPSQSDSTARFTGELLTMDFVELPLIDFFRVMSEEAGINIVLDPKVQGNISIKVEKLPWDQIFDMVLVNHSLDKQIEGNLIRIAHKSTLQGEARQKESLKKAELLAANLETRVKRLNYAKANELIGALKEMQTVRGTVVNDERTNSLVLTDIPASLDKMMRLISTLDIPQPQVEIEARIVSAARDFAREIGVQFGFVQGNLQRVTVGGPNTFGTIGGTRPSQTPDTAYVAGNPTTGRGASGSSAGDAGSVSTGEAGNYNVNLPATKAFGGLGLSVGNIFDTFLLDAAITAGESKGLAKLISQPKVTAQNNSPATISQGTRFPVQVRSNNTTTIQFYNAALTLTVTPQITYEGNIVLDLNVQNNTADWANTVLSTPSIRISESQSRVLVTDGGTTVIGGILVDEESNSGDKVPGLGDLPVIGNLFRRTSVNRTTQEVLFFVTPRIIK